MAAQEDCDWMALLEAAVDCPASSTTPIQFSRSTSPEGTFSKITENDLIDGGSIPLESLDSELGVSPDPVTCDLCGEHNTIAIQEGYLHSAVSELLLKRARKRKPAALDSLATTPDKPPPISQPSSSSLGLGPKDEAESTGSSNPPRKKPRLLTEEEMVALLSEELQELKASLLKAEKLARKYRKYESLYLELKNGQPVQLIPRPEGERGKNGWSLRKALQLEGKPDLYLSILASVRQAITAAGLDWEKTFHKQTSVRVAECFRIIKKNNPYLERFEGNWPARELVISCMQNKRKKRNRKVDEKTSNRSDQTISYVAEGDDNNGNVD
ncbi:hypothetical protein FS837_010193 [Tulasnella sp. UAMH 9824]|nr:hypothetical protein FS837_010193 [Tulasnella sp. UAMH 9824]